MYRQQMTVPWIGKSDKFRSVGVLYPLNRNLPCYFILFPDILLRRLKGVGLSARFSSVFQVLDDNDTSFIPIR